MRSDTELNRIYNENCLDTMARMPDNFVDLTVTSPPYDNLRDYKGYTFDFENIAKQLYRVTKDGGVLVWVVGDTFHESDESCTSFKQALYFRQLGYKLYDTLIYNKRTGLPHRNRYLFCYEFMFVFSKGNPKTVNLLMDRANASCEKRQGQFKRQRTADGNKFRIRKRYDIKPFGIRTNIWDYNTGFAKTSTDEITFEHPAPFPESLAKDHILSWSNEGDLVYDPFMGSGTTAKMAHLLKRDFIGSEISAEYCAIAQKRIEPYMAQLSIF